MRQNLIFRRAGSADILPLYTFIYEHGVNPWNYLPKDSLQNHLAEIETGLTVGIIAEVNQKMVGFVTFSKADFFIKYESENVDPLELGYIAEVVVHKNHTGKGVGTQLLEEAKALLQKQGVKRIYIDRHEENLASAGMMKKAEFRIIDTFLDSERRATGSQKTTVLRFEYI